jgi:hypothetical protein
VRNDFAMLTTGSATVGINLRAVDAVQCIPSRTTEGRIGDRTFGSLHAYLTHLEADERTVRFVTGAGTTDITGRLRAVADDHVLVFDSRGAAWALSRRSIAFVQDLSGS